ncbi:MAM and LDL-receptor class A domain-containing protein 1-like [Oculina patagonica]
MLIFLQGTYLLLVTCEFLVRGVSSQDRTDCALYKATMLIFLQGTYLLLVTCEILVRGVSSQDLTGNCSFDHNQFCNWQNEKQNDHFDWLLLQGSTPSSHTGPISDHSGNGSYIYIETSSPRKYNEKARLNSPWMRGAQRMTFFYSMYGSTVESLSVFVRALNGSEARVWSRYRSHVSEDWIEACVTLNYTGIYQVIMEGVAGLIYTADIAIDDISFSKNLTCFSRGRNALPEIFEANCTFDRNYCGWRNVLSTSDDIDWYARRSGTPSLGTGPSQDHTGSGFFIYIETSNPAKVNQSAQLLSPLIRGPKCFRFYYHMYGRHIGRLDVYLQIRGYNYNHLMWRKSGEQGDQWKEATVEIGYTGESQVVLQAAVGRGYAGDIAVDDVTFTDWPCENGSKSQGTYLIYSCEEYRTIFSNQLYSVDPHKWHKFASEM